MSPSSKNLTDSATLMTIYTKVFADDYNPIVRDTRIPSITLDNIPDLEGKKINVNWIEMDRCFNNSKSNKKEVVARLKSIIKQELRLLDITYKYLYDKIAIDAAKDNYGYNLVKEQEAELKKYYDESITQYRQLNKFINRMSRNYPMILSNIKMCVFEQNEKEKELERKKNAYLDNIELIYVSYKLNEIFENFMQGFNFKDEAELIEKKNKISKEQNENELLSNFKNQSILHKFLTNQEYRGLLDNLMVFKFTVPINTIYNEKFLLTMFRKKFIKKIEDLMVKVPIKKKKKGKETVNVFKEPDKIVFKLLKNGKVYLFNNRNEVVENFRNNVISGMSQRITEVLEENNLSDNYYINFEKLSDK